MKVTTNPRVASVLALALALGGASLFQVGCAEEAPDQESVIGGQELSSETFPRPVRDDVTGSSRITASPWDVASFWDTCHPHKQWHSPDGIGIDSAVSDSCDKKNGTPGGRTTYSGYCNTNLSNRDGVLHCQ
jgi:hypothetical protein